MPKRRTSAVAPASTTKKVVVLLRDRTAVPGYVNPAELPAADALRLLTRKGTEQRLPWGDVRSVYFVREFDQPFEPQRKAFLSRPKIEGLWVRLRFRDDGETLEGVVPNNLLDLLDRGVQITPPELTGSTTRIFVPRAALSELTVLGVVGTGRKAPRRPKPQPAPSAQRSLFEDL